MHSSCIITEPHLPTDRFIRFDIMTSSTVGDQSSVDIIYMYYMMDVVPLSPGSQSHAFTLYYGLCVVSLASISCRVYWVR